MINREISYSFSLSDVELTIVRMNAKKIVKWLVLNDIYDELIGHYEDIGTLPLAWDFLPFIQEMASCVNDEDSEKSFWDIVDDIQDCACSMTSFKVAIEAITYDDVQKVTDDRFRNAVEEFFTQRLDDDDFNYIIKNHLDLIKRFLIKEHC